MSGIIVPVMIHFCFINMIQMMRLHFDAASLTTMAAVFTLPVFIWMMKMDLNREELYRFSVRRLTMKESLLIGATALGCNIGMSSLMELIMTGFGLSNMVQETLYQSSDISLWLGIGVIVPITEEVLFRGLVYQRLKDYNEKWLAIFLAAGIFALYHGNAIQILFAFPMGFIILTIYERSGTILAPILFHMIVNMSSIYITLKG